MVLAAEDRRAFVSFVTTDTFKYAGAVVEAMREYVYLGLVPFDEFPVLPYVLSWLHAFYLTLCVD